MPAMLVHIILHVGLCSAAANVAPSTVIPLRVTLADHQGGIEVDRSFRLERGDDDYPKIVEFDAPQGSFLMKLSVPKYDCSAADYVVLLPGVNRTISENLGAGTANPGTPLLLQGSAPQSFLYVAPKLVLFDKGATACNKPVGDPVPAHVALENDQDSYYAWLFLDESLAGRGPLQLALALKTPTHQYHYVRIPVPFPMPWGGWPTSVRLDVSEDMVDELASEPTNTLLCPKLWETRTYS